MLAVRLLLPAALAQAACKTSPPTAPGDPAREIEGGTATAPTAAPPAPSILGAYGVEHEVSVVCDDPCGWCDVPARDTMVVRDAGAGRIAVEIVLVQSNAHRCMFDGTLDPVADAETPTWRFDDPSGEDGPCALTMSLDQARRNVTIESEGCHSYCGARAVLEGDFEFPPSGDAPPPAAGAAAAEP